jgi:hypothetical protein
MGGYVVKMDSNRLSAACCCCFGGAASSASDVVDEASSRASESQKRSCGFMLALVLIMLVLMLSMVGRSSLSANSAPIRQSSRRRKQGNIRKRHVGRVGRLWARVAQGERGWIDMRLVLRA